jgi:hypothetical protein
VLGLRFRPDPGRGMHAHPIFMLSRKAENGFERERRAVSGDGDTSSLANQSSIFARGGLIVCDGAHGLDVMKESQRPRPSEA